MRPQKPILLYCSDREILSATAFTLRLQPYDVTAVHNSKEATALAAGTATGACSADGLGRMGGTGSGDLESRSSVIRIEDTILSFLSARFRVDCIRHGVIRPVDEKSAARTWKTQTRAAGHTT